MESREGPSPTSDFKPLKNNDYNTNQWLHCAGFQTKYDLRINGANVFIEYDDQIIKDFCDVMLMEKVI